MSIERVVSSVGYRFQLLAKRLIAFKHMSKARSARSRDSTPKADFGEESGSNRDPSIEPPTSKVLIDTGAGSGLGLFQEGLETVESPKRKITDSPGKVPIDSPSRKSIPEGLEKHERTRKRV